MGRSTVIFQVADNGNGNPADILTDQQTINLVVRQSDQAPAFLPIGDQTVAQGQTLTSSSTATDPDGDPLLYSASQPAAWRDVRPGHRHPDLDAQPLPVGHVPGIVLTASDGNLTAVRDPHHPRHADQPAAGARAPGRARRREGTPLQFTLAAADPDGDTLTYAAISGLPAGAQFDPTTGQFHWTPTYDQAGDYTSGSASATPAA